jgi:5-formyltetrahydrofolate cyclo-ligase
MDSRQKLRQQLCAQRAKLTLNYQNLASQKITEQVIQSPLFQHSQYIAAYVAINCEVNPKRIIHEIWKNHKLCYLPILQKKQLIFSIYKKSTRLKKNKFNIPEPPFSSEHTIEPWNLDLVFVPLVGFTHNGARLGMGGGFYDRCFNFLLKKNSLAKPYLIGLAYEWQKIESFDANAWDVPLSAIITEKKTYTTCS